MNLTDFVILKLSEGYTQAFKIATLFAPHMRDAGELSSLANQIKEIIDNENR